jgi:hypothetical protein
VPLPLPLLEPPLLLLPPTLVCGSVHGIASMGSAAASMRGAEASLTPKEIAQSPWVVATPAQEATKPPIKTPTLFAPRLPSCMLPFLKLARIRINKKR